ncbi:unnamed protein product [Bursaphelenchus okinawaensis]|uniref:Tudor domain-containing protein n=1 Tax=Bursaphelenchus okinawaensis TaxID=465554 RepID=A0A811K6W4_9BILA|nr:unnamed protein product [Bursaphelenchus okinawaensis]CAG9092732.1 unnamed protein product [Bursaphelenchus okinawaensis]
MTEKKVKFPGTVAIRPGSPIRLKMNSVIKEFVQAGEDKIHRLILNSRCEAKYVWASSPSCIWFRLPNQDASVCDLTEKYCMEPYKGPYLKFHYCMAPRYDSDDDGRRFIVYSRARILAVQKDDAESNIYCYVFFIDHGCGHWVEGRTLGKISYEMTSIPWQSIPVALAGVKPLNFYRVPQVSGQWSAFHLATIREILSEFDHFELEPLVSKSQQSTYDQYARVRLVGVKEQKTDGEDSKANATSMYDEEDDIEKFDVARLFFQRCFTVDPVKIQLEVSELSEQELFQSLVKDEVSELRRQEIPFEFTRFPPSNRREGPNGSPCFSPGTNYELDMPPTPSLSRSQSEFGNENQLELEMRERNNIEDSFEVNNDNLRDWDPDADTKYLTEQVPQLDENHLNTFMQEGHLRFMLANDSAFRESPHKFFAYHMKPSKRLNASSCTEAMQNLYAELGNWRDRLNAFYFLTENCTVLRYKALKEAYTKGENVYAIYCDTDESDNHEFTRVKLTNVYPNAHGLHEHVQIIFLDRPGTRMVPAGTLLRMHSTHAKRPQMCVQLSLDNIAPPAGFEWENIQIDRFREFCFSDAPMRCRIVRWISPEESGDLVRMSVADLTQAWSKTIFSVENHMVQAKMAVRLL